VTDERVACAAIRESHGAGQREATIVDESGASERGERLASLALRDTTRREMAVDLRDASIAMAQGAERRLDGVPACAGRWLSSRREPPLRSRPPQPSPRAPASGGAALR
jgi:hypothetical protein